MRTDNTDQDGITEAVFGLSADDVLRLLTTDEPEDRDIFQRMFTVSNYAAEAESEEA